MKRFHVLILMVIVCAAAVSKGAQRPNIVFLLTDDQRFDALGCLTPYVVTPEMDRLASEGVMFTNAFVTTSICAASRASILTGLTERTHRYTFMTPPLADQFVESSYPALLRKAGYRTGYIGKLGVKMAGGSTERMFDEFVELNRNPYWKEQPDGTRRHLTDITGDRAVEFIERADERPFCLTVGFNAPHAEDSDPLQYYWPPSADGLYEKMKVPMPATGEAGFYDGLHPYLQDGTMNRDRWQWRFNVEKKRQMMTKGYLRMISGIDHVIGRIRRAIEKAGLAGNTIIIFFSDNGYFLGERGYAGKWLPYEPGIRVPLIIFDPREADQNRGRREDAFALNIDLMPTILDFAGVAVPSGVQGEELGAFVAGGRPDSWRKDIFFEHLMMHPRIRKHEGVRTERFKYIRYFEAVPVLEELYDLQEDPYETTNLISNPKYAEIADRLRGLTDERVEQYGGEFSARLWKTPR